MNNLASRLQRELDRPHRSPLQLWIRRIFFPLLCVLLPLLIVEICLRISGYYRPRLPLSIQWRTNTQSAQALNTRFATEAFVPDRFLLWKMKPGTNLYGLKVNDRGALSNDLQPRVNSRGTLRLLVLGDSTTAVTFRTFPEIAQRLVATGTPDRKLEVMNAAVPGYTTEQAIRWYEKLRDLHSSVVVLSFGWNDAFPALNLPDKELGARNAFAATAHRLFRRTRVYQWIAAPKNERVARTTTESRTLRVSPDDFRNNLQTLIARIKHDGALPVLATQPENLSDENLAFFTQQDFASSPGQLASLHRQYMKITRQVAAQSGVALLDAEEEFQRRKRETLFEPDGMHLSPPGHNFLARLLVGMLRNQKILTDAEFERIVQVARYDSTAPDKPHASWVVEPQHIEALPGSDFHVSVLAQNTGNTKLLRQFKIPEFGRQKNVSYGAVCIEGRWKSINAPTTATIATTRLSHDLLPRETTSQTLTFKSPQSPGAYLMQIGFDADRVGELERFGAETTTLTVNVRPPA